MLRFAMPQTRTPPLREDEDVVDVHTHALKVVCHSQLDGGVLSVRNNVEAVDVIVARGGIASHFMEIRGAIFVLLQPVSIKRIEEHRTLANVFPQLRLVCRLEHAPRLVGRYNVRHYASHGFKFDQLWMRYISSDPWMQLPLKKRKPVLLRTSIYAPSSHPSPSLFKLRFRKSTTHREESNRTPDPLSSVGNTRTSCLFETQQRDSPRQAEHGTR